jgi:serine/threonine protein kinase
VTAANIVGDQTSSHGPSELQGRWKTSVVLKRDLFSTVERGRFLTSNGEVEAVLRRIDRVPLWTFAIAQHLFAREKRALAAAGELGVAPRLLFAGRQVLVRAWIDGVALQIAKPYGDRAFFRSAKAALRKLHRAGICHNDLSKQQNWLRGRDGRAYLMDFQLASCFSRRGRWFRLLAYEDLRHLLKHKHRYLLDEFTPSEWKLRSRKSALASLWLVSGKRVYHRITRSAFGFVDQEGGGMRLSQDAPRIAACLRQHPHVRDAAVVAFYDIGAKHSLYAFVESLPPLSETTLRDLLAQALPEVAPPRHIQLCSALPRRANDEVHSEILQLVASNQIDEIDHLTTSDLDREIVARIVSDRRNLKDRF